MAYDVIVIGLGGMGGAAAHHFAAHGQRVRGLEKFTPPHNKGSGRGGRSGALPALCWKRCCRKAIRSQLRSARAVKRSEDRAHRLFEPDDVFQG